MIFPTTEDSRILSDIAARVKNVRGGPGIRVSNTPGGITISLQPVKLYRPPQGRAAPGLFPVTLTADGGDDGDDTTTPSYTYKWPVSLLTGQEIKNADGTRIDGLEPDWARAVGSFERGTNGTVYYDEDGNLNLFQVDETENICE